MGEKFAIGIDLGTSTSEICVFRNGAPYVIADPSSGGKSPIVLSIVGKNKRDEWIIGEGAEQYIREGSGVRDVKTMMGTGERVKLGRQEYDPERISAEILKKLKQNAEEALNGPIHDVVLSVPANFPQAARDATKKAGELAGLNIIRLINEPTAAALAFGIKNLEAEEQIVMFDFGGGTLDITALEMMAGVIEVKCSYGEPLGGKDFDKAMMTLLEARFHADHPGARVSGRASDDFRKVAEKAKIALSRQESTTVFLYNFGEQDGAPVNLEVEVTRAEFEEAVAPLLERARACVRHALRAKNIDPNSIDRVLLVGGTTYIPCVRRLVAEIFGKEPKAHPDVPPDLAVAMGAAVQAAMAMGLISEESGLMSTDVSPFGLGTDVVETVGGRQMLVYDPLILPNTTIPYSTKRVYSLLHAEQKRVEFRLYQDHMGTARLPSDAVDTGIVGAIPDIPPAEDGTPHPIEMEFSYDIDGLVKLVARVPATGQRVELIMNKNDLLAPRPRLQDLWKQNPKAKRYDSLIQKAWRLAETADTSWKQRLNAAVSDLQRALDADSDERIEEAGDRLTDLLFDLENEMPG